MSPVVYGFFKNKTKLISDANFACYKILAIFVFSSFWIFPLFSLLSHIFPLFRILCAVLIVNHWPTSISLYYLQHSWCINMCKVSVIKLILNWIELKRSTFEPGRNESFISDIQLYGKRSISKFARGKKSLYPQDLNDKLTFLYN